jgi:hypothetical protein
MMKTRLRYLALPLFVLGFFVMAGSFVYAQSAATPTAQATKTPRATTTTATPAATATKTATTGEEDKRPAGWSTESHSNNVDPNYAMVFPVDQVNQITITIAPADWMAMQADITALLGEPGERGGRGGNFAPPQAGAQPVSPLASPAQATSPLATPAQSVSPLAGSAAGINPPQGFGPGQRPAPEQRGPGGFGGGDFTSENPMWVPATLTFEGNVWTDVGVRYKGNSSLSSAWNSQTLKLPFKLDFDEFEDEVPAIKNQRFYGFKQLSLANNVQDSSYLRDVITYDLLEEAGLVAAQTAFYEVILDYGEGPVNLGVYTMIEVIDDTVISQAFDDDSGNIYEGDGPGVSLAEGTFDQIESSFQKENNEEDGDWRDIEALYTVLHDETRTTDPASWRAALEAVFAVDSFLEWLALSAVIEHWDTYGAMTHNFYLYHDPETALLTWISWDHNLVLGASGGGPQGGGPQGTRPGNVDQADAAPAAPPANNRRGGRGGPGRSSSLDKADVDDTWPLISYLIADPVYYEMYLDHLQATLDEIFIPATLTAKIEAYADILAPYAAAEEGVTTFDAAIDALLTRIESRYETAATFLAEQ